MRFILIGVMDTIREFTHMIFCGRYAPVMTVKPNVASLYKGLLCLALCVTVAGARPNSAIQAFNSGVKFFNAKEYEAAIPHFDDAIAGDADFAQAYFARGVCKYYLKSSDGALLDMNEALRLKPDYIEARALRGAISYESDQWD